jgi:hypothetical protein
VGYAIEDSKEARERRAGCAPLLLLAAAVPLLALAILAWLESRRITAGGGRWAEANATPYELLAIGLGVLGALFFTFGVAVYALYRMRRGRRGQPL